MTKAVTEKLVAEVVEVLDLGERYPTPVFSGRIGLDLRMERGELFAGKRVRLCGPCSEEEVQIEGIEMLSNPHDRSLVRIFCSKPKIMTIPTGKLVGWSVAED